MNKHSAGFSLIEMIIVITVLGVISVAVGMMLSPPITAYAASRERAALSLTATSAISQITRDIRSALPNSLRMAGDGTTNCIEMLPTNGGGRYRADPRIDGTTGNPIDFSAATLVFDVLAGDVTKAAIGDMVAIYNLGIAGANAYAGDNTAVISAVSNDEITLAQARQFPTDSPGQRFFTLPAASSVYLCLGAGTAAGNGTGTLYHYSSALNAALATCPESVPTNAVVVASNISSCVFSYTPGVSTRTGVATMLLGLTRNNESIQLYREAHVDNTP